MKFNKHFDLEGQHAFLSASSPYWLNYDLEKLENSFAKYNAIKRGTELHNLAKLCISSRTRLPKVKRALNQYVNDALDLGMIPEQVLYYSQNAFGTADAISFKQDILRIHDLKTGVTPVKLRQLEVYAALFCLEYEVCPKDISMELRIYQSENIVISQPSFELIEDIIKKIVDFDRELDRLKQGEEIE